MAFDFGAALTSAGNIQPALQAQQRKELEQRRAQQQFEQQQKSNALMDLYRKSELDKLKHETDQEKQSWIPVRSYIAGNRSKHTIYQTPTGFKDEVNEPAPLTYEEVIGKLAKDYGSEANIPTDIRNQAAAESVGLKYQRPLIPKGLAFDKATGQVVSKDTGQRYNSGDPSNPPEVAAMFQGQERTQKAANDFLAELTRLRGQSYGVGREMGPLPVFDTENGNAPTYTTYLDMQKNPGRYIPATPGAKAIAQENLMEDLTGTSAILRKDLTNLKEDFPTDMKVKIAAAMRADDPHAALDQLIASSATGDLSDDQMKVLIDTRQLAENAMAMRSVLGAGQGSEDVRDAIRTTLPSLLSPNKKFALMQLDAYDATIQRLHRGVPKVPLNNTVPKGTPNPKNITDDQILQGLSALGKHQ